MNRFHEGGIKAYTAARQTKLNEDQRLTRVAFFEYFNENFNQECKNRIIFSDEKTFKSDFVRHTNVYRPRNTRYEGKYRCEDQLSGRISASYWGAIGLEGPFTDLVRIEGHFNSQKYLKVLEDHLVPAMSVLNNERFFMQDNSPIHTSEKVMNYLSDQKFQLLDWCPYSPDVNPIENVWACMTRDWPTMQNRTQQALDEIIQRRWTELKNNPEYFRNLYDSLPNRCEQIRENNGYFCKY